MTKHQLFAQNSNLISRSINITRSLHVKRPTLNIITWLPAHVIKFSVLFLPQAKCFLPSLNIIPIATTLNYYLYFNQSIITLYVAAVLLQFFTSVLPLNSQLYSKTKFDLHLITCTQRDKIHAVYHTGEPLHYSQIRSFKIPTIHFPISTSPRNKTSLNTVFVQFRILLSSKKAHENKSYSLNTTTDLATNFWSITCTQTLT